MNTRKYSGEIDKLKRHQKEQANRARREVLNWYVETFPEVFDTRDRVMPLKKGIMNDIFEEAKKRKAPFSKSKLRQVVVMFTNRLEYLACLKLQKDDRIDLYGNIVSTVSDEEALVAANVLRKRIDKMTRETLNEEKKAKEKKPREGKVPVSYPYRPTVKVEPQITKNPHVVVKRKVTPERIARMREKLGLPNKENEK